MPSIIGNLKINSIGSSGVLNVGDSFYTSPKSTSSSNTGSGSSITGDFVVNNNLLSRTNTATPHLFDYNIKST